MTKLEHLIFKPKELKKINCPLCQEIQTSFLLKENDLNVVNCPSCGFIYVNPEPTLKELKRFYNQYYPKNSESLWEEQMEEVFQSEGLNEIEKFKKTFRQAQGKILDVGCGYGFFLESLKKRNWQIYGVEISKKAVSFAQKNLGRNILEKSFKEAKFPSNFFDVVTFWYVLEHLKNPLEDLKEAHRVLKRDGLIIVRVPNESTRFDKIFYHLGKWAYKFFLMNPPRHLNDFRPKTLFKFLEKSGFLEIKIKNSKPRKTGTKLQLLKRKVFYGIAQIFYYLTFGSLILGTSMTAYGRKREHTTNNYHE